jgi:MYXO-CTERM domain-containing protein
MALIRTKQRGVIRLATSLLLAAMGTLLGATGCASDDIADRGSGEAVSEVQQRLCGLGPDCPENSECGTWVCSTKAGCLGTAGKAQDGDPCKTEKSAMAGICVAMACCTGCRSKDMNTGAIVCDPLGFDDASCGGEGAACRDCNTVNQCDTTRCNKERKCEADPVLDGEKCTGGACLGGKCCTGCIDGNGQCQPGSTVTQCGLATTGNVPKCKSCDDGNVCNNDSCQNGVCAAPTPKAGSCADANKCNGDEQCSNGSCQDAPDKVCSDGNPCTDDGCDAVTGACVFTPKEVGTSCDDATVCNGISKCQLDLQGKIFCKAGTPPDLDDSNVCTTDTCDPVTGPKHTNNTADCSDNNICTLVDKCSGGTCVGSGAKSCDDNEFCTDDSCDPKVPGGCVNTAKKNTTACDDGNECTDSDQCVDGKCFGAGKQCDDMNVCTKNTCNPQSQACSNPDENNGTPCPSDLCHQNSTCQAGDCQQGEKINCDDGNPCTKDDCTDGAVGCTHEKLNAGDCSDNDQCTTGDKCVMGVCQGTPKVCGALDDCHLAGTCDSKNGSCDDPRADDDIECDNGNGTCQIGKCEPLPGTGGAGGEGAGGEPSTGGTAPNGGTGGSVSPAGGETTAGPGGEGNEPGPGGATGEPGKGGTTSTSGGTVTDNGGEEGIDPERAFVRNPGGCSCRVPSSGGSKSGLLVAGLAALVAVSRRRKAGPRQAA